MSIRLAIAALTFFCIALAQGSKSTAPTQEMRAALQEIIAQVGGTTCGEPVAWEVKGNLEQAVQFLMDQLDSRGWQVIDYGQLPHSYAVVVDPNPQDPKALALAGLMPNGAPDSSSVFLAECVIDEPGPPSTNQAQPFGGHPLYAGSIAFSMG